jgi:hypothetical protein
MGAMGWAYAGPVTLASAGGTVLGVGLTLIGVGVASQDEARELCGGDVSNCPESARYPALRGRDEILAGDVLTAVGGTALAASIAWMIGVAATEPTPAVAPAAEGFILRF